MSKQKERLKKRIKYFFVKNEITTFSIHKNVDNQGKVVDKLANHLERFYEIKEKE
jgi:putative NIF3 family GTP cyclohydrolase 1 type 2